MSRDFTKLFEQPWTHLIQKQNDYLRHIIDAPAQQLARAMQDQYKRMNPDWVPLINSGVFDAMQRIQESTLRALGDATAFRAARALETQTNIWRHVIDLPIKRLIERDNELREALTLMSSPALQAISNETLRYFQSASAFGRFPESFVGQMLDHLQSISGLEDEEDVEREAGEIVELFNQGVSRLRPDFISREGMIGILLALVILWYSMYEGRKTEQRILEVITQTESRLLEKIDTLRPDKTSEVFYMVRRKAQLRARPSMKKPVIGSLYPPQRVSLIEGKGKWIYVRYFSFVDGVPQSGWALKKYLERVDIGVALTPKAKPRPKFGSGKGLIKMSDDFDEPLKDFEEYS